ncbi:phage tail protein [Xaviernesmea oryzae]|uniref:Phage tail protein n=1 Tax=Xaviernesmea oryzae TaxID=464029 RepID=A0A1Q9B2L5_9HYPH|nr:GntR family transcriptional regulator [Xaviernesmea oryzae]OLP62249.1 phage tail protein [Xaviernesmea oryzae]SEL93241.1 GntR family transcriptional regulator [Xaviernesmea oryzae]
MGARFETILTREALAAAGPGPLYRRLRQVLEQAVTAGPLSPGDALPPERDLAEAAGISRVTLRKALDELVRQGLFERRHGSGTFVAQLKTPVGKPVSRLTSFTEDMARRGLPSRAEWLERGLFHPSPDEMMVLGLKADVLVARLARLRIADEVPLAVEWASIAAEILPDPMQVSGSLYAELTRIGARPVRAVQRMFAQGLKDADAALLKVAPGSASLVIERVAYLASGRVVEFTRSIYRGDAYDFVAELTLPEAP